MGIGLFADEVETFVGCARASEVCLQKSKSGAKTQRSAAFRIS